MATRTDIQYYMEGLNLPEEAKTFFTQLELDLMKHQETYDEFMSYVKEYGDMNDQPGALEKVVEFGKKVNIHEDSLHFLLLLKCLPKMYDRYMEKDLSEQLFWDSAMDLKYKLLECYENDERWGTFVAHWFKGFFNAYMFKLGRLEFHVITYNQPTSLSNGITTYNDESYTKGNCIVKNGDKVINIHIPSSGEPFDTQSRLDAYKKAYEFFADQVADPMPFVCSSWLLYPEQDDFLPADSNILSFMHDFDIISHEDADEFKNAWRVFGKYAKLPVDQWPQNTSLRKAYAQRLLSGKKAGHGYGIFFFDGEKIIK